MSLALDAGMVWKLQIGSKDMAHTHALARSSHSRPFVELQHSLSSHIAAISPAVDLVMSFVSKFRKVDGSEDHIDVAVHEALTNAVIHGNHQDPNKRVFVACRCSIDGEVSITIRDQGQGFDSRGITDPTTSENLLSPHGRGIYLMHMLMDEVSFDEGGVVVRMRKNSNAGPATQKRSE
jgi:serine/threonine-protein kinase RsbW